MHHEVISARNDCWNSVARTFGFDYVPIHNDGIYTNWTTMDNISYQSLSGTHGRTIYID